MPTLFYISSFVAILATIMVITRYHPIHALLYLVVSFLGVAMIFLSLGAPFVAVLEIILYAGAIIVLLIFVVMMLNLGADTACFLYTSDAADERSSVDIGGRRII